VQHLPSCLLCSNPPTSSGWATNKYLLPKTQCLWHALHLCLYLFREPIILFHETVNYWKSFVLGEGEESRRKPNLSRGCYWCCFRLCHDRPAVAVQVVLPSSVSTPPTPPQIRPPIQVSKRSQSNERSLD